MSIKEAIERGPMDRHRTRYLSHQDSFYNSAETYRKKIEAVRRLFEESGVRRVLNELADVIRPEFPDVAIVERGSAGGLSLDIEWNHRSEPAFPNMSPLPMVDMVVVQGDFLGDNLTVSGEKEKEVLRRRQWESREVLEDAIAIAFKNPLRLVDVDSQIKIDPARRVQA